MNHLPIILYILGIYFTILLFRCNYIARVKRKEEFYEVNDLWRKLDSKIGPKLTVVLSALPFQLIFLSYLLYLSLLDSISAMVFLGMYVGIIGTNAMVDSLTLDSNNPCVNCEIFKKKLEELPKSPCYNCKKKFNDTNWNTLEIFEQIYKRLKSWRNPK